MINAFFLKAFFLLFMKKILLTLAISIASHLSFSQDFEMNHDLENEKVVYQNVLAADSMNQNQLKEMLLKWEKAGKFDLKIISDDQVLGEKVYQFVFQVVGKRSEFGKEYDYRFTAFLKLQIKDQKLRYTFYDFVKKTSPGEPGMNMESYIASYKPKISSVDSRDKASMRLDGIEKDLHDKVNEVINDLKAECAGKKDEW